MKRHSLVLALALAVPGLRAQDYGTDKPPPVPVVSLPLTAEQKSALHAVDVRMAGVETLIARIDEPAYRASSVAALADLKKRRAAIEKNFDPGLYEALMHAVISRYQVVALWLTPPRVPGHPGKSARQPAPTPTLEPAAPGVRKTEPKPAQQ